MSNIILRCSETGCCLHDRSSKEFYCIAETHSGERCGNPAHRRTPYCRLHARRCLELYQDYKKLCDPLKSGDMKKLTTKQLEDNIKVGSECARLRINHFSECFQRSDEDTIDIVHQKAINYAYEVVRQSKAELYRRKYDQLVD